MDLIDIYRAYHPKAPVFLPQNERENIFKKVYWQGIHLQNIQTSHVAQYQKKTTQLKMGRRSK